MTSYLIKFFLTISFTTLLSTFVQAEVVDTIEQVFEVSQPASFRLDNVNGSVAISAWEHSTIKVIATVTASSQDDRDNIAIDMQPSSQGVKVETRYKEREGWGRNSHNNSAKVEYVVKVPSSTILSLIDIVNGSLTIDDVKGSVQAQLVNGSIKAKGLASNSEFSSVNGSIKVHYREFADELESISLETVNGSIKASVPKPLNAQVDAETTHGSIKTDFGLVVKKNLFSGYHMSEKIGSGDVRINMASVNGSVKLSSH